MGVWLFVLSDLWRQCFGRPWLTWMIPCKDFLPPLPVLSRVVANPCYLFIFGHFFPPLKNWNNGPPRVPVFGCFCQKSQVTQGDFRHLLENLQVDFGRMGGWEVTRNTWLVGFCDLPNRGILCWLTNCLNHLQLFVVFLLKWFLGTFGSGFGSHFGCKSPCFHPLFGRVFFGAFFQAP